MGFARECWPFVLPFAGLAALLLGLGHGRWALASALVGLVVLLFFRIPERPGAGQMQGVLSPANGKVLKLETLEDPAIGSGTYHRIVIFLSVFNVHVQRSPVDGTVIKSRYTAGRKLAAFDKRAGEVNEQQLTVLQTSEGDHVGVRQIAGLLARRVVSYVDQQQDLRKGDLMGVIKFGSRVDLILSVEYDLQVEVGQKVTEGETVMAHRKVEPK